MKAIVCRSFGPVDQLDYAELPARPLLPHEVRVRVHAAGVNFPDSLKVEGLHQIKPPLPWVPGSETGGVVEAVGEDVRSVRPGDRVMGVSDARGGGFAEQIVLDAARVFALPAAMSFEEAAATPAFTAPRSTRSSSAAASRRANGCWYWARPVAWAWPRCSSARPWARA